MEIYTPNTLKEYKLLFPITDGHNSVLIKAKLRKTGKSVCLKRLTSKGYKENDICPRSILTEAYILNKLEEVHSETGQNVFNTHFVTTKRFVNLVSHQTCPGVYAQIEWYGFSNLTMCRDMIIRSRIDVINGFSDLINIIQELHRHKIVHRNINPSNIFVKRQNLTSQKSIKYKLLLGGWSSMQTQSSMAGNSNTLTPVKGQNLDYLSPEGFEKGGCNNKVVDAWAITILME